MDLELAHEPEEEVGPLEPERPCRPRAIAARLGQGRLDEPPFEIAGGNQRNPLSTCEASRCFLPGCRPLVAPSCSGSVVNINALRRAVTLLVASVTLT